MDLKGDTATFFSQVLFPMFHDVSHVIVTFIDFACFQTISTCAHAGPAAYLWWCEGLCVCVRAVYETCVCACVCAVYNHATYESSDMSKPPRR